jgi:hypothetical protein
MGQTVPCCAELRDRQAERERGGERRGEEISFFFVM